MDDWKLNEIKNKRCKRGDKMEEEAPSVSFQVSLSTQYSTLRRKIETSMKMKNK